MPRKRPQATPAFEVDPELHVAPQKPKRRRRKSAEEPDAGASLYETPYYGGAMTRTGPTTMMSGGDFQQGFARGDQPPDAFYPSPRRPEPPILVAGHDLLELGIDLASVPGNEDAALRRQAVVEEIKYQRSNIPALPPSKVPDLPPKEDLPPFEIPAGIDAETRKALEEENNRIAKLAQDMDRERNNMAAKKSRGLRIEGIAGYRELCVQATTRLFFHRLVHAASGRDPDSWDRLPAKVRADMLSVMRRAVHKIEVETAAKKKAADAQARVQRAQEKKAQKAEKAASLAGNEGLELTGGSVPGDDGFGDDEADDGDVDAEADEVEGYELQIRTPRRHR